MEKNKKLGGRITFNLILFGLMGQMAWAVENQFFNTFLFNKVGGTVECCAFVIELQDIKGRDALYGYRVESLTKF